MFELTNITRTFETTTIMRILLVRRTRLRGGVLMSIGNFPNKSELIQMNLTAAE